MQGRPLRFMRLTRDLLCIAVRANRYTDLLLSVRRPSESALSPAPQPIFSSNNPFRRRLPTPSSASQEKPKLEDINPIRSFSNNPFLDSYSPDNVTAPKSRRSPSPLKRLPNGDNLRTQRHPSNVVAQVVGPVRTACLEFDSIPWCFNPFF